jgi:hypothetical protein
MSHRPPDRKPPADRPDTLQKNSCESLLPSTENDRMLDIITAAKQPA